jgi:hypothetical protein
MEIVELKTDCQLQAPGKTVDALIHLVEVRYSETVVFWNGVLQLTKDNMVRLGNAPGGTMPIGLVLADGRTGFLHITQGQSSSGDYHELAGVGKPNEIAAPPRKVVIPSGNKTVLRFSLIAESINVASQKDVSPCGLLNKLNSVEWMGKEPGSCRVIHIQQKESVPVGKTAMMDHAEFLVFVGYRPHGWISDVKDGGRQRLNGWRLEVRDQRNDGTLLDGHGKPLPEGAEPVYLTYEIYHLADYSNCDFGTFLGEQ